jgi:MYXO-CTERM domain-containing protein
MQRRVFLLLGLMLVLPAFAQASVISIQPGQEILQPGLAGQTVTLLISGADLYSDSNLRMSINGGVGPAPAVEAVFGDTGGTITGALLAGSVWAGGSGGIGGPPNGTTADSSGLETIVALATNGFAAQNTGGIYATLTVTTVGVGAGDYVVDLSATDLLLSDPETGEFVFVPLTFGPLTLSVVPEPSSIVMGLFAAAGLAAVVVRRRRAA